MRFRYRSIWMVVLVLVWATPVFAQTATVTLQPQGESVGPIASNDVVHLHHWGDVLFGGQPIGKYVIRRETAAIGAVDPTLYPLEAVLISIQVPGVGGTLMMHGAPANGSQPFIGNVTVVPAGLEFLRGARFELDTAPVTGVRPALLTFTF